MTARLYGLIALGVAGLILVGLAGHAVGLRWDPFGLTERRLETARAQAARAASDAAARSLEAGAEVAQRARVDIIHHQGLAVERVTVHAKTEARRAHDADEPLDPIRADRLGEHDRELCRLAPELAGCSAATEPG